MTTPQDSIAAERPGQWVCASTNPRVDKYANGLAGRRLHGVRAFDEESDHDMRARPAACGRLAKYGWCVDLHNEKKCIRCLRALGLACSLCHGKGSTGRGAAWKYCAVCRGTGERR